MNSYTYYILAGYYDCILIHFFQIRHPKQLELKKLIDLPILLHFKLSSSITLEVAATRCDVICGPKFSTRVLKPGIVTPVYLRALSDDKYVYI